MSISLNKARWVLPDVDFAVVERMARRYDLPEIVARMLVQRGVAFEDVAGFLNPTLRENLPDPFSLKDMAEMAEFMVEALNTGRKIAIFGDFDVDGATSAAVLYRFLKHCGVEAPIYIPGRLTEGYGPNVQAFESLKVQGAEIVFLLDCGTTAFEPIAAARDMGLEIIVLDHHEPEMTLPQARFVVNPKRKDDESGLDMLAAVGVVFMVCVALNKALRDFGFYESRGISEVNLKSFLDLVALGTVCDMVPLTHVNRLLVRQGFAQMDRTGNAGLRALMEVSGLKGPVTPYHAGFVLGPRINAGSRVHKSDLGARLLTLDAPEEAQNIAWILNDCNDKRKEIQVEMEESAIAQAEAKGLDGRPLIFVWDEGWHSGLSGLVAGRLKEKYKKPACVVSFVENAHGAVEGRGSGRSVAGVHIAQSFMDARAAGIIEKGGGHAMAGGFTVLPERLEDLKEFLEDHVMRQIGSNETHVETLLDGVLSVRGAKPDLVKLLDTRVGPFGQGHPEPVFLLPNVKICSADVVGGAHVRLMISDWEGGSRMKAMAFRAVGTPLGSALLKQGSAAGMDLIGMLKVDNWSGADKTELHVHDARPV